MADHKVGDARSLGLGHGVEQGLCQLGDGHAGVGGDAATARARLHPGKVRVMPRGPQAGALLGRGRPFKCLAPVFGDDVLHRGNLLLHAGRRTVELHQKHRRFGQAELGVLVDHAHRVAVEQLAAGNGHAHLNDRNRGVDRVGQRGESAGGGHHGLGQRVDLERYFGDHAQRAFAAHHQAREVVAGRRLFGAGASADDVALGGDHLQCQHVLTHGAVAHCIGAAGPGGTHAADAGVGAGIDGEKQSVRLERLVKLLARHAGLHPHRQVLGLDGQHLVHARDIQADTALHRQQMPLQGRTHTKRNDRHFVAGRQRHGVGRVGAGLGKHHSHRRGSIQRRLVAPMLLAYRQGSRALRAKARLQSRHKSRIDRAQRNSGQIGSGRGVHGQTPVSGSGQAKPRA